MCRYVLITLVSPRLPIIGVFAFAFPQILGLDVQRFDLPGDT